MKWGDIIWTSPDGAAHCFSAESRTLYMPRGGMWASEPQAIVYYPTPRRWHSQPDNGHDE